MKIPFCKMSGCGNDFIIIDNRENILSNLNIKDFIKSVCKRKYSIGADGLILLESSSIADFKWKFYNSDASIADMCGNGARCISRYAFLKGITTRNVKFETTLGIVKSEVIDNSVKLLMPVTGIFKHDIELEGIPNLSTINTGVPHAVINVVNLDEIPVKKLGEKIRFHKYFIPQGVNVNFMKYIDNNNISIRTYERGVEDETLACGTGAIACALLSATKRQMDSPINVTTKGGHPLTVFFEKDNDEFKNVYLKGDARLVYEGNLWEEGIL